jgi:hypothetical protein
MPGASLVHGVEARTAEQVGGEGDCGENGQQNVPQNARATSGVRNLPSLMLDQAAGLLASDRASWGVADVRSPARSAARLRSSMSIERVAVPPKRDVRWHRKAIWAAAEGEERLVDVGVAFMLFAFSSTGILSG